jgi:uncharacterized protein YndB with AHSA1/START domain
METNQVDQGEFVITRVFDAPLEVVWKQWIESEKELCWWVPKGLSWPHRRIELRVGGTYLYCSRAADGKDFWGTGVYHETILPDGSVSPVNGNENAIRVSYYGMISDWPLELLVTVSFEEHANKTELTLRHAGIPEGQAREMTEADWNKSLDKLVEELRIISLTVLQEKQEIIFSRVFDAPRKLVFMAYTDPTLMLQWWGPKTLMSAFDKTKIGQGGVLRFIQKDASGNEYAFNRVYRKIEPDQRVDYTFFYEGMPGNLLLEKVSFEDLGGKTKVTDYLVLQTAHPELAQPVAILKEGANESMERFEELLSALKKRNIYGKDNQGRD